MGKFFSICITFLGVGMVAIPTGIISAGFVEQYTQFKQMGESGKERQIQLLDFILLPEDSWTGKTIRDLDMPANTLIAAIRRGNDTIVPRGDVVLLAGDKIVIGAVPIRGSNPLELKEMSIGEKHSWNGFAIRELDISRREFIVLVKRGSNMIVPRGSLILKEGDVIYLYKELSEKKA
jgi:voltage-gated potassium channel